MIIQRQINMIQDRELVSQILKGNERSLRFFYTHYQPRIATYIKNKVAQKEDAEEIMQDVLLATLEALRDFAFKSSLFTFICSIANHKVIDYYRKKKIKQIFFSQIPEAQTFLATLLGPEHTLDENLLKEKIKYTFAKITPKYRAILKLKYIYGYSVCEIAQKLSISFKSAESQLFRARKSFVAAYSI